MRLIVLAVPLALLAAGCASTPPEPDPVQTRVSRRTRGWPGS